MKLILQLNDTDGYTYSCDRFIAVDADSKEELGLAILEEIDRQHGEFLRQRDRVAEQRMSAPSGRRARAIQMESMNYDYTRQVSFEFNGQRVEADTEFHESDILTLDEFFERARLRK